MVGWFSTIVAASSTWTILIPITIVLLCCAVDTPYCDAKEKLKDEKSRYIKKAKISIPIPIQFSRDLLIFWHTKIYVPVLQVLQVLQVLIQSAKEITRDWIPLFNWSFLFFDKIIFRTCVSDRKFRCTWHSFIWSDWSLIVWDTVMRQQKRKTAILNNKSEYLQWFRNLWWFIR